jgi:hypothetical protein
MLQFVPTWRTVCANSTFVKSSAAVCSLLIVLVLQACLAQLLSGSLFGQESTLPGVNRPSTQLLPQLSLLPLQRWYL